MTPAPPHSPTLGLILAGGLARRLGGRDKALIPIAGRPVLAHIIARLAPACTGLILNANGDPARFAPFGLTVVADSVPDFPGPLAGILAGLDWAATQAPGVADVASVAGDGPFIPRDLVARLHAARAAAGVPIACAVTGGWRHPTAALWPVALRDDLRRALAGGMRRVQDFAARHGIAYAEWPVQPFDPFFNVNTPEDVAAAEALARTQGGERAATGQ